MKERRRFVRFDKSIDVHYRILESLDEHMPTYTKNLSEKGIRVSLSKRLEPGTFLEIAMRFPGDQKPVWGIGKIAWQKRSGKTIDAGIDLTYVRLTDRWRYIKHLEETISST